MLSPKIMSYDTIWKAPLEEFQGLEFPDLEEGGLIA